MGLVSDRPLPMRLRLSNGWPHIKGVTVVEILVVIAIIGVLIALLLPVLSSAKAKAARTACINNQKQLATALLLYAERSPEGAFPSTNLSAYVPDSIEWFSNDISRSYRLFIAPELGGNTRVLQCPADTFAYACCAGDPWIVLNQGFHQIYGVSYGFNGRNYPTNVPPPYSGLAGVPLERVPRPERTVLTYDGTVFPGYTWHEPKQPPDPQRPVRNVMSFVDGHVEFLRTVGAILASTNIGVLSEPPAGYDYQWNAN